VTERYQAIGQKVYLEFDDKDPEAKSDYEVDFAALIDAGFELTGTPVVEIEAAGNGESPLELESADPAAVAPSVSPDPPGSPPLATAVSFWLTGGTSGVRYRGKIKCDTTGAGSPAPVKTLVKRFYVVARLT
jgi:hypothetical protein